jgi:predicted flap endonuclease-1-like 5' DNA nuclease
MPAPRAVTHPNESAFPHGVGGPVLRALANAGIRSMAELAQWSQADVAALHGVGPKGIRMLSEALRDAGKQWNAAAPDDHAPGR